ncbi:MAG: gluconate 2-dehydrogenase subunit 3 family protein [Actinomycetota bacterium]
MPDPASIEALRAAVETVVPPTDGMPGALDLRADEHIATLLEQNLPGSIDMLAALLNAYANDVRAGASFVDLSSDERGKVFRAMSTDESQDIRDVVDALLVFSYGGTYSEWSGYDRATGNLKAPPTWAAAGFHGPVHGHPDYRVDV